MKKETRIGDSDDVAEINQHKRSACEDTRLQQAAVSPLLSRKMRKEGNRKINCEKKGVVIFSSAQTHSLTRCKIMDKVVVVIY